MNVLITGASGFIGKNLVSVLKKNYNLLTPSHKELDCLEKESVERYISEYRVDAIIYCLGLHQNDYLKGSGKFQSDSVLAFRNVIDASRNKRIVYLGSGAEYDKSMDISMVDESVSGARFPKDDYGQAKAEMYSIANEYSNIVNLRVFGCFGPGDEPQKFITHSIRSNILGIPISIRKDCYFDYLHVNDLAQMIVWALENETLFNVYNACSGTRYLLSDIAQMTIDIMKVSNGVRILSDVMGNEYTGSNRRIMNESHINFLYPTLLDGIKAQVEYELANWTDDTVFDGE